MGLDYSKDQNLGIAVDSEFTVFLMHNGRVLNVFKGLLNGLYSNVSSKYLKKFELSNCLITKYGYIVLGGIRLMARQDSPCFKTESYFMLTITVNGDKVAKMTKQSVSKTRKPSGTGSDLS